MNDFFCQKDKEIMEYRFSDPKKAYNYCLELLEHGTENEEWYEVAYAYLYMGDTLFSLGEIPKAIDYMLMGEKIQKKYGFLDLLVKNYNILAIIYMVQGDDFLALDNYFLSLELAKKNNNYALIYMIYNNIGALLHNRGDADGAIYYFKKGIENAKKQDIESEQIEFNIEQMNINICARELTEGNIPEAKKYLDNAYRALSGKCSKVLEINMLSDYAAIYYKMEDYDKAYEVCSRILGKDVDYYLDVEIFSDYADMADILLKIGKIEESRKLLASLEEVCKINYSAKRQEELCCHYIDFYKNTKDKEKQDYWYAKYYEARKDENKELIDNIVTAIDNRWKLELEKDINEQLSENNSELVKESEFDELTKINNRYGLKKNFDKIYQKAINHNYAICVAIFDIDYFKKYNDTYGHIKGDECLKKVASILFDTAGNDYEVARYGGDEFVIIGLNKTYEQIDNFLSRLLNNIREENIMFDAHPTNNKVTISLGAVNYKASKNCSLIDYIHSADGMLYKVKEKGKNGYLITEDI